MPSGSREAVPRREVVSGRDGRRGGVSFLAALAFVAALVHAGESRVRRSEPVCLAISPLRAVAALAGKRDTLGPEGWRDALLASLRKARPDSSLVFRAAGECPEGGAVLDVFQLPTDVVASAQGQAMLLRMEWKHVAGPTEFFLSPGPKGAMDPALIASQLLPVVDQRMARIELSSAPAGAEIALLSATGAPALGQSPQSLLVPPGALSVSFQLQGKQRRIDTLVVAGSSYQVFADFQVVRIDPQVHWEPPRAWPLWSLAAVSLAGGLWAAREQVLAQRAYSRLGPSDGSATFAQRWSDLRTANLWRNGLFSASAVFTLGAGWLEWSSRRNP